MNAIYRIGFMTIQNLRSFCRRFFYSPLRSLFRSLNSAVSAVKAPSSTVIVRATPAARVVNQPCKPITILSANLWHDWPRYRQLKPRLNAFANLVSAEMVDIILLQEVARTSKFKVDEWLSDRLGMGYTYVRANGHESEIGFEEGLAVYSRFPLCGADWQQLGTSAFQLSRRMALGAEVKTPCGNLKVFSVHLGLSSTANRFQLDRLRDWVGKTANQQTSIIGGDFNSHENRAHIQGLQKAWVDIFRYKNPDRDGMTHELRWPWGKTLRQHRLDYLFMQNGVERWDVLDADHIHAQVGNGVHSDHRAVLARVVPVSQA